MMNFEFQSSAHEIAGYLPINSKGIGNRASLKLTSIAQNDKMISYEIAIISGFCRVGEL